MEHLAEVELPAQAKSDARYPVTEDHCFKRIAFDAAVGRKWDASVQRPFYRYATDEQLATAIDVLRSMREQPDRANALNRKSLSYRRSS